MLSTFMPLTSPLTLLLFDVEFSILLIELIEIPLELLELFVDDVEDNFSTLPLFSDPVIDN